ncbi:MAG: PAS domain-containing sensor histidine kinase [Candidatus Sericytochromatia bacterium]|nr:PAS domain-containing sensor histidine kinase [Candidatus Sericytochromatia bacterium]
MAGGDQSLERAVLAAARALTAVVALLALLGLWGRLGGWPQLQPWPPASLLIARDTAAGLGLAAAGLALRLWPGPRPGLTARLAAGLGLATCVFGLAGLAGWLTHSPPGATWTATWTPTEAWPLLPLGPFACALAGLAVLALDWRPLAGLPLSDGLALLVGVTGAAPVVSYAANLAILPRLVEALGLAPLAGLAWNLFAAALLLARPGRGLGAILVALGPGGGVARRMLPVVAAVPAATAASRLVLEWGGWGGSPLGAAAEMLAMMGLAFLLVLWTSYPLEWSEQARRAVAATLRDREARLRGLIEATPDAVFFLDEAGRITAANPAAAALFRLPAEAFLGHRLTRWVCPEPAEEALGPGLFDTLAGSASPYISCIARRPDGGQFPAELSRTRFSTAAGTSDVAICRDVSERRHAAEALASRTSELAQARALERLKDHVYSSLSHELKTPLTIIQGNTEMLQEDWPDDPRLRSLEDAVQRLNERIEALLDHAALLGGDLPLYRTPTEATEVLTGLAERYRAAAAARNLALHVACETELPVVTADARRLSQALTALIDNAVKFAPAGGHIGVRAREEAGDLVLEVWNSGPGLPPSVLARLGETFYQSDVGDSQRRGGLGLGLAIARMLVALHGGTLTVASVAGQGTTFAIRLPPAPPETPGRRPGRPTERPRGST